VRCGRVAEVPLTPAAGGLLEPAVAVLLLDADADMAGGLVASAAEGHVAFVGLLEAVTGVVSPIAYLFVLVFCVQPTVANCWNVLVSWFAVPWFADITFDVFFGHTETR